MEFHKSVLDKRLRYNEYVLRIMHQINSGHSICLVSKTKKKKKQHVVKQTIVNWVDGKMLHDVGFQGEYQ